ncbi:hypothetical protein V9T40_013651 [Parthenolecanium corni]|uniref:Uncharacterized protein n=1 Tax=Parthenolecanium corni TaxID=536013 RepID=A0AAN9Y2T6_9HEMI
MLPLLIFLAFSLAQINEPVSSLHLNSGNALLAEGPFFRTDELQLFQRGLENTNKDEIPLLDTTKAVLSIGQIRPQLLRPINTTLTRIMNVFGESLLSQLFEHIRFLIRNPRLIKQFSKQGLPSSGAIKSDFTREALLVAVEELSNESIAKSKKLLETLQENFKDTEMKALFLNIIKLLEYQPTLQKYAELCKNVDESFGLDKPLDLKSLGLPVPTEENPVVYFQLKDDKYPTVKFFVKVKLEKDQIFQTILVQTENGGSSSITNSESNDEEGLENLYRLLPISNLIKP